jgi:hypothetical protein
VSENGCRTRSLHPSPSGESQRHGQGKNLTPFQKIERFTIKQAAAKVGISEGLLILWISTGKFKPSIELSTRNHGLTGTPKMALEAFAGPDGEAFGWNRFLLTAEDVKRLSAMVEQTAERKAREPAHVPGRHYTAKQLAVEWGMSPDTIRKLFEDEPGVLRHGKNTSRRGKRRYLSIRIPEEVAQRIHNRRSGV